MNPLRKRVLEGEKSGEDLSPLAGDETHITALKATPPPHTPPYPLPLLTLTIQLSTLGC